MSCLPDSQPSLTVIGPVSPVSPLVFDSPHSWRHWPAAATRTLATPMQLDTSWDAWVHEIWAEAIDGAAPLLAARFHQAYIDAIAHATTSIRACWPSPGQGLPARMPAATAAPG